MSFLEKDEILALFVNTMTPANKYSLPNSKKFRQPIQIQLYQKQKMSSRPPVAFLESRSNFQHAQTKDGPHSLCIFETRNCERLS